MSFNKYSEFSLRSWHLEALLIGAPFSRKLIVMSLFRLQKAVEMTLFTDCCPRNFFLTWFSVFSLYELSFWLRLNVANPYLACPVGWDCRIHRLHLCRGVRPPPNECPEYDTKQSDGEVPVILELWGMWSTPSLPLTPGPLWPGVVVPNRVLFMG